MPIHRKFTPVMWIPTIFFLSGLLGCGLKPITMFLPAEIEAKLVRVRTAPPRQVIELQEAQQYEDERIIAHWDIRAEGIFFVIQNKGQTETLKVLWDEVVITDVSRLTYDVTSTNSPRRIPESAKVAVGFSRGQADDQRLTGFSPKTQAGRQNLEIAHGIKHYSLRIPHSISLSEGSATLLEMDFSFRKDVQKWMEEQLQAFKAEVESYNGKTFSVLIPMLDAGKEIEYLFTFRLQTSIKEDVRE